MGVAMLPRTTISIVTVVLVLLVLGACAAPVPTDAPPRPAVAPAAVAGAPAVNRAETLSALYEEYWQENLRRNPVFATFAGDARYNDQLPNFLSADFERAAIDFQQRFLDRAKAVGADGLTGQDRLSYDIFVRDREMALEGARFPDRLLPVDQFGSFVSTLAQLGSGTNAQPFATVADYDNWLRRVALVPALFDQAIANMREGIAAGVVQPRVLMEKVIPQLDALNVDAAEKSVYWGPIKSLPVAFSSADRDRLTSAFRVAINEQLLPSQRKLRQFIVAEYLPKTRSTVGISALPDGQAWYAYLVRDNTTTQLTAAEIHAIGLAEVARIQQAMHAVGTELGYRPKANTGLTELFAWIKARPEMYFKSREELLASYRAFRAGVDPLLPQYFNLRPKADYEIRTYEPFREAAASAGSYQGPSLDGKRPGIFYVNAYDLKARPRWALASLSLHEAAPGHHFQIALQRELTNLPMFRRFSQVTAFIEGWGLYAEFVGYEMGVYKDPVARFGALDAELWRSIRLVVDTGIHAKGWTRQQVLDYMYANSPAEPTRAISEAERFMAIPGQALAYKIGQLKIIELRRRAEAKLAGRFELRAFHDEVLRDGSVPLDVLEMKIDRWIVAQAASR
jgi:uncharacterized protein (DUF885 family)